MNKVFLIGRLTQAPTASTTNSGTNYCRFSIAVNRTYSRDGERIADFFNIIAWNATAQNCVKFLEKGSQVAVSGSIQTGSYERDGIKRYTVDIIADQVEFLSRANNGGQSQAPQSNSSNNSVDTLTEVDDSDDEMPF